MNWIDRIKCDVYTLQITDLEDDSSAVRIFHNETNAPNLAHVPLVDLPVPDDEPYERIPAECFTMSFDCKTSPGHMCCAYHQR